MQASDDDWYTTESQIYAILFLTNTQQQILSTQYLGNIVIFMLIANTNGEEFYRIENVSNSRCRRNSQAWSGLNWLQVISMAGYLLGKLSILVLTPISFQVGNAKCYLPLPSVHELKILERLQPLNIKLNSAASSAEKWLAEVIS